MSDPDLPELYRQHQGNVSDKWSSYLSVYEEILQPQRDRVHEFLEIGVQNGGSLELWAAYFPGARKIIGCDVDGRCRDILFSDPRISVIVGDVNTAMVREQILAESGGFDVIIDDGSHTSGDIIRSVLGYFSLLRDHGLYIIEDLHCSYWETYGGGLHFRLSAMNFLKYLADLLNREHWVDAQDTMEYLRLFREFYNLEAASEIFASLHSVEFRNSLAILRKSPPEANRLGRRVIAGTSAPVEPGILEKAPDLTPSQKVRSPDVLDPAIACALDVIKRLRCSLDTPANQVGGASPLTGQLRALLSDCTGFLGESTVTADESAHLAEILMNEVLQIPSVKAGFEDLERRLAESDMAMQKQAAKSMELQTELYTLRTRFEELEQGRTALREKFEAAARRSDTLNVSLRQKTDEIASLEEQLTALLTSKTWRYTHFLRAAINKFSSGGKPG